MSLSMWLRNMRLPFFSRPGKIRLPLLNKPGRSNLNNLLIVPGFLPAGLVLVHGIYYFSYHFQEIREAYKVGGKRNIYDAFEKFP